MVKKGNGDFEILEKNEVVATGRVYVSVDAKKEKIILEEPADDDVVLEGLDFYRYVLIRGYNYKDAFRSIKQTNSRGLIFYLTSTYIRDGSELFIL